MPKDNINCIAMPDLRVEVSWATAGHVQLATVHTNSPAKIPSEPNALPDVLDGWNVTLDRAGVNRLIRSLRKARDAAFGADA